MRTIRVAMFKSALVRTEVDEYQYVIDPEAIDRLAAGLEKGYLVHEDGPEVARARAADLRRMAAELRQGRAA
jgi:hypothetical protein